MTEPELTLNKVKETAKVKNFRARDFLTDEQVEEVKAANIKGKKKSSFDAIDAYIAEIIARFGYDTFVAWKFGEISEIQMAKYIEAERSRDAMQRLMIENIIVASVAGANNPTKGGQTPKSLKAALRMIQAEQNLAKGVK